MTGSIELDPDGKSLQIRFPYRPDLVDDVKTIPGRRWDRNGKLWRVPADQVENVVAVFMRHGFDMSSDVTGLFAGTQGRAPQPVADESPTAPAAQPDALSISNLNERVRRAVQDGFPEPLWVVGEVCDYDKGRDRKHLFFALAEKRGDSIVAQVDVAMFERTAKMLSTRLANRPEPLSLCDGLQVRVLVRVDLYPRNGRYQLIIEDIDAEFTLGKLLLGREEILRELREKGLARRNLDLPMPVAPLRIAVLSSLDSDGWNDFHDSLTRSGMAFDVTAYDVRVQGEQLRPTVLAGLRYFAERAREYDLLCILRGGGSRTDLLWFDDREVALAVACHPLKVVCGIGHQRDQSVLDVIAHSEKTPTAVAELLVAEVRRAREVLADLGRCLADLVRKVLGTEREILEQLAQTLRRLTEMRVLSERRQLDEARRGVGRAVRQLLAAERVALLRRSERLRSGVRLELLGQRGRLAGSATRLATGSQRLLERAAGRLATQAARQRLLDPARVLERGYALARDPDGRILTGIGRLRPGATVAIQMRDGTARAEILETRSRSSDEHGRKQQEEE
ncbi:MAG: exodeoxyribonuclease VII large subunit [Planctomycetes bacterium]|nr:exodeoxyribonuclease VII large subunit [Planctomycetota bacterium]